MTVSDANRDYIERTFSVPRERIHVIPCGVDTDLFCPLPSTNPAPYVVGHEIPPLIVCVARLVAVKNLGLLLDACALLAGRGVKFRCALVGEGPLRAELEAKRTHLGLEQLVDMPGAAEQREVLLHGDSNVGNYFFSESAADIVAVSDFEFGFLGPPECDLAWFFMVNDSFRPDGWAGDPGNDALASEYERASDRPLEYMDFYYTFSTARLAFVLRAGLSRLGADSEAAVLSGPWGNFERHFLAHS